MLLAGDIGGTKTDLAIYSPEQGPRSPLVEAEYPSAAYAGLDVMARAFLTSAKLPVTAAYFDVAGPVIDGRAKLTNLPWEVSEAALAQALDLGSVRLVNDLVAIATAVPLLTADDVVTLNSGTAVPGGAIAVVAPGTGLGEAFLTWDGARYLAYASEGGHCDFAPADAQQLDLLQYMRKRYDHVSYERVCSGGAIPDLYEFVRDTGGGPEAPAIVARLAAAADRTPVIVEAALDPAAPSKLCAGALELFVSILGAEAGNLALKTLATGGVYLAGGMPMRIAGALQDGRFLAAFRRKGRFAGLLASMPVHVVDTRAALIGAASLGLESLSLQGVTP